MISDKEQSIEDEILELLKTAKEIWIDQYLFTEWNITSTHIELTINKYPIYIDRNWLIFAKRGKDKGLYTNVECIIDTEKKIKLNII